jgi:hypothetical protein
MSRRLNLPNNLPCRSRIDITILEGFQARRISIVNSMPVYSDRLWFKYPLDRYDVDRQYSSLNYWQSGISIERTSIYTPHIVKIAERNTISGDRIAVQAWMLRGIARFSVGSQKYAKYSPVRYFSGVIWETSSSDKPRLSLTPVRSKICDRHGVSIATIVDPNIVMKPKLLLTQ